MNSVQESAMKLPSFDGTLLSCRVWEDPATDRGTQVVMLLHGLAHHGNAYGHVGGHLAAAGIPVCAWDARGHGYSGGDPGTLPDRTTILRDIDAVVTMLRARYPGRRIYLMGESMGGLFSVNYAGSNGWGRGLGGIILVAPGLLLHHSQVFHPDTLRTAPRIFLQPGKPVGDDAGWRNTTSSRDATYLAERETDTLSHQAIKPQYMAVVTLMGLRVPLLAGNITCPVLILHGERDRVVYWQASRLLHEWLGSRDKEFVLLPEAWHTLFWDPETPQVLARVTAWLLARDP
jgi:acylglycerol lipase